MVLEDKLLATLCRRIENQLGWGSADNWTTQEFETLSDRIAEVTSVTLSTTTLKRIWGKVNYTSQPSTTTLNALAGFLGYDHWRDFCATENNHPILDGHAATTNDIQLTKKPSHQRFKRSTLISTILSIIGVAILGLLLYRFLAPAAAPEPSEKRVIQAEDYFLNFRPVASGVPNSVVFNYRADRAPSEDVYLQQSWDATRREKLTRDNNTHTSIYYLPGYYRAKLVVDERTVKEKELFIRSDDWVAAVDISPVPVYLPLADVRTDSRLMVTQTQLTELGIPLQPTPPKTIFTNVGALENLWSDNFSFRTRLRHDYAFGAAACQYARVLLLLKNSAIIIPLSAPGCVAELELFAGGERLSGKSTDLSSFGVVGDTWLELACTGKDDLLTFSINGREIFQLESKEDPKEIVGIRYEFSGTGSVDYLNFSHPGGVVWEDDF